MLVLVIGLVVFGIGDAFMLNARLGAAPWTTLATGIAKRTPLDVGETTILISVLVLLAWIPLRERPGIGTLANALIIGLTIKLATPVMPEPLSLVGRFSCTVLGIVVTGIGGALYLSTQLGPGPRDGWMTGLAKRFGLPLARVRLGIEVAVLTVGFLLGGQIGVGTVLFAVLIGHVVSWALVAVKRFA